MWTESDGVMVNSERNLTLFQPAVDPPGQALPDWQIIARIACAMGFSEAFSYESAEDVFEEIKRFWNPQTGYDLRGVSYERLRQTPGAVAAARRRAPATATRSATSTTASARPGWSARTAAGRGLPSRPRAAVRCSSPARICCPRKCPTTTSRSCSTPGGCRTSGTR